MARPSAGGAGVLLPCGRRAARSARSSSDGGGGRAHVRSALGAYRRGQCGAARLGAPRAGARPPHGRPLPLRRPSEPGAVHPSKRDSRSAAANGDRGRHSGAPRAPACEVGGASLRQLGTGLELDRPYTRAEPLRKSQVGAEPARQHSSRTDQCRPKRLQSIGRRPSRAAARPAAQVSGSSRMKTSTAMSGSRWLSLMNAITLWPVSCSTLRVSSSPIAP